MKIIIYYIKEILGILLLSPTERRAWRDKDDR